jgi:hypothetical protein
MRTPPRRGSGFLGTCALGVLLLLPVIWGSPFSANSSPHVTHSGGLDVGDGLFALSPVQRVTASAYWDNFYCPHPWPEGCTNAVGAAYVPSGNLMVISEGRCNVYCNTTENAVVEFDADTGKYGFPLALNCYPSVPYYPGSGSDYFVPCGNYNQNWASIVSVNYLNDTIAANISDPVGATSMAYDSSNGLLYAAADAAGSEIEVIDPISGSLTGTFDVPGATFAPSYWYSSSSYMLVYDSFTNRLVVPSTTNGLLFVDPTNGTVTSSVRLPAPVESLAFDSASNQLFAATDNNVTYVSGVSVLNARTYSLEARVVVPNCVQNTCVGSNDINQVLTDPSHGDAYLVGALALFTLNLSTLTLVGTLEDYGNGPPASAPYIPGLDQVISTYAIYQEGPGLLDQLHHGSVTVLSSLLWMPPAIGVLLTAQLAVGGIAAAWVWILERRRRRKDLGAPPRRFGRIRWT